MYIDHYMFHETSKFYYKFPDGQDMSMSPGIVQLFFIRVHVNPFCAG